MFILRRPVSHPMNSLLRAFLAGYLLVSAAISTALAQTSLEVTQPQEVRAEEIDRLSTEGRVLEANLEYLAAIDSYSKLISIIEQTIGPYASEMIDPLMGLARTYFALSEYEAAIAANQQAQHLIHRHQGVYALDQLEGIKLLVDTFLKTDQAELADKQQHFSLFLSEHNFGADSPELMPALEIINLWYSETGQFNKARKSLQRSREIVKTHTGEHSPKQLDVLIQLAKIRRLSRLCCSYKVLEEALEIVDANPDLKITKKIEIYVELADAYTVARKRKEAARYYNLAWSLLNAHKGEPQGSTYFAQPKPIAQSKALIDERSRHLKIYHPTRDRFSSIRLDELSTQEQIMLDTLPPQEFQLPLSEKDYQVRINDHNLGASLQNETILAITGSPFTFNHKQFLHILPSSLKKETVSIELDFTVDAEGKIRDITIISKDSPKRVNQLMRSVLRETYYRPRLVKGIAVETKHVKLTQSFAPELSVSK